MIGPSFPSSPQLATPIEANGVFENPRLAPVAAVLRHRLKSLAERLVRGTDPGPPEPW